jgi:FAD/FMN-containing dehydrogenase
MAIDIGTPAGRVPGIDYDGIPESLAGTAVAPGDPEYRAVSSTFTRGGAPGLVLRPASSAGVADALAFAKRHRDVPLGLRSAGHGFSGRSTNRGGLIIDVGALNTVEVLDRDRRLVRTGPGATWKQVATALSPYGWAIGSGDYGGVGVGGLVTAGGIGLLSRGHGLAIDHLRAVELVLADGSRVRASENENPELFWAVRGAGANFGVATAFEFSADEIGDVGWVWIVLTAADLEGALRRYAELASAAPRDTTIFLVTSQPGQDGAQILLFGIVDSPDPSVAASRVAQFRELGEPVQHQVVTMSYAEVMGMAPDVGPDGHQGSGDACSRSAFLPTLTPGFARDAAALLRSGAVRFFQLRAMGGAIADVATDATAFAHRTPAFQLTAMGWDNQRLNAAWDPLRPHFDGLYLSFETNSGPAAVREAFPPTTLARLRELKRRYDPGNLFRDNFNIEPDAAKSPTP